MFHKDRLTGCSESCGQFKITVRVSALLETSKLDAGEN